MIQISSGRVRIVLADGTAPDLVEKARRERERFMTRMWRARNRAKVSAWNKARRAKPGELERERERKRRWREANRERYNAYFRRYDALKPGRREYKAAKEREYRARRAAA